MIRSLQYHWITGSLILASFTTKIASAAGLEDAAKVLEDAGDKSYGASAVDAQSSEGYLPNLIGKLIGIFLLVIGGLFMLLLIYGGYMWMTARGDTERVKKAKEIITNALIGLVIVFAAYAISTFVLSKIVAITTTQTP